MKKTLLGCSLAGALIACSGNEAGEDAVVANYESADVTAVEIPASLAPFGDGHPNAGDPCRRLGESAATVDYLDDSAVLVGCPTAADAAALGGNVVGTIEGVSVVSVPSADANEGMSEAAPAAAAADNAATIEGIENRRVSFASGANSATVEDSITGREIVDHILNVRAGQSLNISMGSQNPQAYFNILEPGETAAAVHTGSIAGNQFEGTAAKSGDYRVRVYLMRAAARRDETANYRLEMIVD